MKKSILTVIGILGVIVVFCFIFFPRESFKINVPFFSNGKSEEYNGKIKLVGSTLPGDYKDGYFYIKNNDLQKNIMYFDYDSKKEVYLCSKPNCKHDNDTCSSYLNYYELNELFYYNNFLYYIDSSANSYTISVSFDGVVDDSNQKPSTLYRINVDGTLKQKMFVTPSGTRMDMPLVIKGNMLYGYLEKSVVKDSGSSILTEKKLIAINLDSGEYEILKEGLYESLIGTYDDKLVIQEIDYIKDPNDFENDDVSFANNLYNSKTKIKLFDIELKREEVIFEDTFKNMESIQVYKNGIYFIGKNSKNLEYVDFTNKTKKVIKELPQSNMNIEVIIDDKVLVNSYKNDNVSYYVDLLNGEMKEFNLRDKNNFLIEILSSNDDYYFVKVENVLGEEYTTWAGTKQQELIDINYGLIKKSDYWASNANYIKMTNVK
jgi:hypothetical protein